MTVIISDHGVIMGCMVIKCGGEEEVGSELVCHGGVRRVRCVLFLIR